MPIVRKSFRECASNPLVFGSMFSEPSWANWRTIVIGLLGEEFVNDEERNIWREFTGLEAPTQRADETWLICGRRAGKSRIVATISCFVAVFIDFSNDLAPGEWAEIALLASTAQQAGKIFEYISGILEESELLKPLIARQTNDIIELSNQVRISIRVANFRSIRGITSPLIVCDEIAYWQIEGSANPDKAILDAARPCLSTLDGMLLCASSPYAKRGELYEADMRYSDGHDKSVVIIKGQTKQLHPDFPQKEIDKAFRRDPEAARAEYLGEYRNDVAALFDRDVVESLVVQDRHEIPKSKTEPQHQFHAFVDVSGGGKDSFCLAVAHSENGIGVLDCIREVRPPLSLEAVVAEFATVIRSYGLAAVTGDGYGGNWPSEAFSRVGISYVVSERNKSEIYVECLPLINSGKVELLDNKRLVDQLCSLERRTSRGTGKDIVDHPQGGHDDCANVVCGALVLAIGQLAGLDLWQRFGENAEERMVEMFSRY